MKKEEILKKHCIDGMYGGKESGGYEGPTDEIYLAMDEWAKEMAIGFANWMVDGTCDKLYGDYDGVVYFDKPPEELFQKYVQSLQK